MKEHGRMRPRETFATTTAAELRHDVKHMRCLVQRPATSAHRQTSTDKLPSAHTARVARVNVMDERADDRHLKHLPVLVGVRPSRCAVMSTLERFARPQAADV